MKALISHWSFIVFSVLLTACSDQGDSSATTSPATSEQSAPAEITEGNGEPINKDLMTSLSTIKQSELVTSTPPAAEAAPAPTGPDTSTAPKGEITAQTVQGKVLEVIGSGDGISYIQVEAAEGPLWVAVRSYDVAVGDVGEVQGNNIVMNNFYSKSLDRTFEKLVLSSAMKKVMPGEAAAGQ